MLATADIVETVADAVGRLRKPAASSSIRSWLPASAVRAGRTLLTPEAVSILKTRLLPLATVVTPNVAEAAALCGIRVDSRAARVRRQSGSPVWVPRAVVIKGGHLSGPDAVDVLFHAGTSSSSRRRASTVGESTARDARSRRPSPPASRSETTFRRRSIARSATSPAPSSKRSTIGRGARILNHFWTAFAAHLIIVGVSRRHESDRGDARASCSWTR